MKVTDPATMLQLQGEKVLLVVDKDQSVYTIVLYIDGKQRELQLVNRTAKAHEREAIPLSQAALDRLEPIKHKEAKWKLVI